MGKKPIGIIELENGEKKEVLAKNGKFYVCADSQFFRWRYPLKTVPKQKKEKDGGDEA